VDGGIPVMIISIFVLKLHKAFGLVDIKAIILLGTMCFDIYTEIYIEGYIDTQYTLLYEIIIFMKYITKNILK